MSLSSHDKAVVLTRLSFGSILLAHGLLKVMVFGVAGTVGFFESMGLPAVLAHLTIFGEVVGGAAIILGIYTRLAGLLSAPIMAGALWAHIDNGWVFSNEGGGWEFPALLVVLAIVVSLNGNGPMSIKTLPIIDKLVPASLKG